MCRGLIHGVIALSFSNENFRKRPLKRRRNGRGKESGTTGKMEPQARRQKEQPDRNKTTGTKDTIAANKAATGTTTN